MQTNIATQLYAGKQFREPLFRWQTPIVVDMLWRDFLMVFKCLAFMLWYWSEAERVRLGADAEFPQVVPPSSMPPVLVLSI